MDKKSIEKISEKEMSILIFSIWIYSTCIKLDNDI